MQKITPYLWCNGDAETAGAFYAGVFGEASFRVASRYPDRGLPDFQRGLEGKPLVVEVDIRGYRLGLINADDTYRPTPAISFIVNGDPLLFDGSEDLARAEIERMWAALADDGEVRIPLGSYPHSALYGWVEDRHGVNWQLMLTDPAGSPRPFLIPQLAFTTARPRAAEAMSFYTSALPDSAPGRAMMRPDEPGSVLFAEFTLAGQWFSAMDAGAGHDFTFTPGVSLAVDCADQDEIDRLWGALSAVPEAERCGWLVDRFGVSWQIVPSRLDELLAAPGAYDRMLQMGRIVIADL